MPVAECFIDTNILLYAISTDPLEAPKTSIAKQMLLIKRWAWSAQIAAEFVSVSTLKKRSQPQSLAEAEQFIDSWAAFQMISIDRAVVKEALKIAARYGISYYDAQVIAAAKVAGCSTMYSEDLNHGQDYDGVRVLNPFLASP